MPMRRPLSSSRLLVATAAALVFLGAGVWRVFALGTPGSTVTGSGELRQPFADGNGLVGWWKLDGDAKDSTANHIDGTLTNFSFDGTTNGWVTGRFGNALLFNGTNNYVNLGNPGSLNFSGTASYTISEWIKPKALAGWLFGKQNGGVTGAYSLTILSSGKLDGGRNNGVNDNVVGSTVLTTGTWYHVAYTYNGTTQTLFVNGASDGSQVTGSIPSTSDPVVIGATFVNGSPAGFFNGSIDDVRVYSRALSAAEIAQLYLGSQPPNCDQTCKGWWKLNESSGTSASDSTGLGRTGTLHGTTGWVTGVYANALSLDGSSGYLTLPDLGATSGTVEFWIDPTTVSGDQRLFSQAAGASTQAGSLAMNQSSGESGSLWVWDGSAWQRLSSNGSLVAGAWNHVVVQYSGSSATAYINSQMGATATTAFAFSGVGVTVGGPFLGTTGGYYSGALDDLRFWNRIVPDYEIADHFRAGL